MTKEELEKEAEVYFKSICGDYNEEYERTGKRHYFVGFDIKNGYLAGAEPREKRIAELEKENAELKGLKDVATLIRANNDTVITLMQLNNKLVSKSQQLTKAKEIIKSLYFIIESRIDYKNNIGIADEMWRAEQFWKVEK